MMEIDKLATVICHQRHLKGTQGTWKQKCRTQLQQNTRVVTAPRIQRTACDWFTLPTQRTGTRNQAEDLWLTNIIQFRRYLEEEAAVGLEPPSQDVLDVEGPQARLVLVQQVQALCPDAQDQGVGEDARVLLGGAEKGDPVRFHGVDHIQISGDGEAVSGQRVRWSGRCAKGKQVSPCEKASEKILPLTFFLEQLLPCRYSERPTKQANPKHMMKTENKQASSQKSNTPHKQDALTFSPN